MHGTAACMHACKASSTPSWLNYTDCVLLLHSKAHMLMQVDTGFRHPLVPPPPIDLKVNNTTHTDKESRFYTAQTQSFRLVDMYAVHRRKFGKILCFLPKTRQIRSWATILKFWMLELVRNRWQFFLLLLLFYGEESMTGLDGPSLVDRNGASIEAHHLVGGLLSCLFRIFKKHANVSFQVGGSVLSP